MPADSSGKVGTMAARAAAALLLRKGVIFQVAGSASFQSWRLVASASTPALPTACCPWRPCRF
eukprot:1413862-Prorocentrum_lima.AAC.1